VSGAVHIEGVVIPPRDDTCFIRSRSAPTRYSLCMDYRTVSAPTARHAEELISPRDLRILHGTADPAWQATLLAHGLREEGYRSSSLAYSQVAWGEPPDVLIDTMAVTGALRAERQLTGLIGNLHTFDVFHVHAGKSLLFNNLDIPLLHAMGKRFVFHFHGSDIRRSFVTREILEMSGYRPSKLALWRQASRMEIAKRYGSLILVSTPDILNVLPEAIHLPVALRLDGWGAPAAPRVQESLLRIAHAPTSPSFKGTRHLEAAVALLRDEGLPIELDLIHQVSRSELPARLQRADVCVDQLRCGWYGLIAVEALALGIPTICYIRPDLKSIMAPLPFIDADIDSIAEVLRRIWHDRDILRVKGGAGRRWVEKWHDLKQVTRRLIDMYAVCFRDE